MSHLADTLIATLMLAVLPTIAQTVDPASRTPQQQHSNASAELPPQPDTSDGNDLIVPEAPEHTGLHTPGSSAEDSNKTLPIDNHIDYAEALLQLLSDTEVCLNSCRDEASTQAAEQTLRALAAHAEQLADVQADLPEPTLQDHMAMHRHVQRFNRLWSAIREHIARLEAEKLMSPALRSILRIAPPSASR